MSKRAPWNKIKSRETVYFKYAGGKVIAVAEVEDILQFTKKIEDIEKIKVPHISGIQPGEGI